MLARNAWEKRKLREVSDVRDGTHASPKYYSQGYPLVTSKNLTSAGLDFSNISLISELDYKNINKRSRVDKGDILFGMIGTIGTPVMVHESNFAIKNVALIKEREAVLNSFLVQLLKSPAFINYIRNENVGGTQKFLSLNTIRNFRFSFPTSKEQAMVSRFLEKIDSLIAATQRRIDDLEQVEKTLLQHLFDQSWRFNVYSDPWVKSKVANMAKENFGGGTPSTKKRSFWTGSLPWIQSSDLDKSNKYTVIPKKFISSAALKSSAAKKVPSNSIAVVTRVGVGKLAFINYDYATSQDFLSFSFLNWSAFFSVNLLTRVMEQMSNEGQGTSIKGVTKSELLAKSVLIPTSLEEQISIGNLLKSFDDLIKSTSNRLSKLELLKTSLLKNLFV
ncbi:restriction endonuclease subunit S [Lacticaseibacillus paracasei]|uniref:restriction endonuclease subunit S n=1 Tax=Lacticaseibacillus paracasei TaxID=1597 RepID=UPI0013766559|nr:restriction endonuclease subunit S [Lacticaseibacillus paracasei]MCZ2769512.1 restriction endonuclease subunit S [Lacticaseibacillus paracasei]MCZ2775045.1 restriction endonuclease subunit S [Lacticaseibacillus paracasei]MCZ2777943.1 restriction endonuclease subunit S [Lacticaseibacillus paracasei]MCZ2784164.1 restriction endonuclease subunit S [Lacticaseibacillus paracasei]MDY0838817.1 restriction endonuclease subunit S [Lacticaseibacillus paracasei]